MRWLPHSHTATHTYTQVRDMAVGVTGDAVHVVRFPGRCVLADAGGNAGVVRRDDLITPSSEHNGTLRAGIATGCAWGELSVPEHRYPSTP